MFNLDAHTYFDSKKLNIAAYVGVGHRHMLDTEHVGDGAFIDSLFGLIVVSLKMVFFFFVADVFDWIIPSCICCALCQ